MSDTVAIHPEIIAAVEYLCSHLTTTSNDDFRSSLTTLLVNRYQGHWHPNDPEKGSAYRAITRTGLHSSCLDAVLKRAASKSSLPLSLLSSGLKESMSSEKWTMWIDPGCVSIRLHDAVSSLGGQTVFGDSKTVTAGSAGIKEIWGKLPASLGLSPLIHSRATPTPAKNTTRARAMSKSAKDASVAAEFDALVLGASPSKRSKAIAIVRPGSAAATMVAPKRASTPPPPLPPLAFTIEESTSPYVPSFATGIASSTFLSSSRSPTPTPPLPLPSSPLAERNSSDDPFARPSSRSSTTSVGSATSCSIFSHSSSESRSSSIGSFSTMASTTATNVQKDIPRATPFEMNAAATFQFPGAPVGLSAKSAPSSPSKNRRAAAPRHGHTLSTSSVASVASSTASSSLPGAPTHTRGRSSQSNIRISTSQGTVQDYSNGKVGVLGGGVLLGLGGGAAKKPTAPKLQHRPSSSSSSSSSGTQGETMARPRSKSRTPSMNGQQGGLPMWYNQHQYNPMPNLNHHAHSWSGQMAH